MLHAGELEPSGQALDLDSEDFGAARSACGRIRRNVREARIRSVGQQLALGEALDGHWNGLELLDGCSVRKHGLAEGRLAHPVLAQPLEIDLRGNELRVVSEPFGLDQDVAVL